MIVEVEQHPFEMRLNTRPLSHKGFLMNKYDF